MAKTKQTALPHFHTRTVLAIHCDLCTSVAYSRAIGQMAPDCQDAAFAGRGWKVYSNGDFGRLQVCPRCSRKLSSRWIAIKIGGDQP